MELTGINKQFYAKFIGSRSSGDLQLIPGRYARYGGRDSVTKDSISDPYMKKIDKHWHEITGMYVAFENKKPLIEFDPNRFRIIAYPAEEYIDGLSERTRDQTKKQYREACVTGAIMVFVRDEQKEILRSYIFPRADEE